jgi:hypothetical protein
MAAAGAVVGVLGAKEAADATSNMNMYKAGVAQANAQIAETNARRQEIVTGEEVQRAGLTGGQALGWQKVGDAAGGLRLDSGSAVLRRTSQLAGIQTNEGTIAAEGAQKAYGYRVQGMDYTAEGQLDILGAQNAQVAGGYQEATSFLGGATGVADKWSKYAQAGVPGFQTPSFGSLFGGTPIVG